MAKRNISSTKKNEDPPKLSWNEFLDVLKSAREKVAWIVGIFITVFVAGFASGKFYESIMNKFTIQDLERKHSDEIQKISQDHLKEKLSDMKSVQNKLDSGSQNRKEVNDEK